MATRTDCPLPLPAGSRAALLALVLILAPEGGPAALARPARSTATKAAPGPQPDARPVPPPVIQIVRRVPPEERARREREEALRREQRRSAVAAWARSYRPAVAPLRRALDEALGSLAITWGPYSRNLGYPVEATIAALEARIALPAPDPELDRRLRRALLYLKTGASACRSSQPTVAQMRLYQGQGWLDQADDVLRSYETAAKPR